MDDLTTIDLLKTISMMSAVIATITCVHAFTRTRSSSDEYVTILIKRLRLG